MKPSKMFLFVIMFLTFSSCGTMMEGIEKVADPYSKKLRCPAGEGFDCMDVEKTYKKDELLNNSTPSAINEAVFAGETTELTIAKPLSNTYENIIELTFKTASDNLSLPNDQIDPAVEKEMLQIVRDGSTQSATERLVGYIQSKRFFPDIEAKLLRSIAEDYSNCIREANTVNGKKLKQSKDGKLKYTEEDAIASLRSCTVFLKSVPGLVALAQEKTDKKRS